MFLLKIQVVFLFLMTSTLSFSQNDNKIVSQEVVEMLIDRYTQNPAGWPSLPYSILQNDFDIAKEILRRNPSQAFTFVPFSDGYQETYGGQKIRHLYHSELIRLTNALAVEWIHGPSALSLAVSAGTSEMVNALLEAGASPDDPYIEPLNAWGALEENGRAYSGHLSVSIKTPLFHAIDCGHLEIVRLLISRGASTEAVVQTATANMFGYYYSPQENIKYYLSDVQKINAFSVAAENDSMIRLLIHYRLQKRLAPEEVPAELVSAYKTHSTTTMPPLYQAICADDVLAFQLFLEAGEDPSQSYLGKNALDFAVESTNPVFLDALHKRLSETEDMTSDQIAQLLEDYKKNSWGWPPLHYAIAQKKLAVVREILRREPEQLHSHIPFQEGTFAFRGNRFDDYPKKYNIILKEHFVNTGLFSEDLIQGPSVLTIAVRTGAVELVQELLELGANPNAPYLFITGQSSPAHNTIDLNLAFQTPLSEALILGNAQIIHLLLEAGANPNIPEMAASIRTEYAASNCEYGEYGSMRCDWKWIYTIKQLVRKSAFALAAVNGEAVRQLISYQSHGTILPEGIPQNDLETFKKHSLNPEELPSLHHAILTDDFDDFQLMLSDGADPAQNYICKGSIAKPGKTAFELALESKNPTYFQVLSSMFPLEMDIPKKLLKLAASKNFEGFQALLPFLDPTILEDKAEFSQTLLKQALNSGNC